MNDVCIDIISTLKHLVVYLFICRLFTLYLLPAAMMLILHFSLVLVLEEAK